MNMEDPFAGLDNKSVEAPHSLEKTLSIRTRESSSAGYCLFGRDETKALQESEHRFRFLEESTPNVCESDFGILDDEMSDVLVISYVPLVQKSILTPCRLANIQQVLSSEQISTKMVQHSVGDEVQGFEDFAELQQLPTTQRFLDRAASSCLSDCINFLDKSGQPVSYEPIFLPQGDSFEIVRVPNKNQICLLHRVADEYTDETYDLEFNESDTFVKRWIIFDFDTNQLATLCEFDCCDLKAVVNATACSNQLFSNINGGLHSIRLPDRVCSKTSSKVKPEALLDHLGQPIRGAAYSIFDDNIYSATTRSGKYSSAFDPIISYWESRDKMTVCRSPGEPEPVFEIVQNRIAKVIRASELSQHQEQLSGMIQDNQEVEEDQRSQKSWDDYSKKVFEEAEPVDAIRLYHRRTGRIASAVQIPQYQEISAKKHKQRILTLRKVDTCILAAAVSESPDASNPDLTNKAAALFPHVQLMAFSKNLLQLHHNIKLRFCSVEQLSKMHKHPVRVYGHIFFPLICYQQISMSSIIKVLTLVTVFRTQIHVIPIRLDPERFDPLRVLGAEVSDSKLSRSMEVGIKRQGASHIIRFSVLSGASPTSSRLDEITLQL